jgi:DNA-binding FrmR family transcriptional regulator
MPTEKKKPTKRPPRTKTLTSAKANATDIAVHAEPLETGCCAHKRYKHTERETDIQKDLQKRLNRTIGQLNGIKVMIDDNRYCGDVLTQLAASENAIKAISGIVLRDHLETCVVEQIKVGNIEVFDEVMQLMRKFS